jgi:hypothetical protein
MGPLTQQFFFSSFDVIATKCFGDTTIIRWHKVVYCLKLICNLPNIEANWQDGGKFEILKLATMKTYTGRIS